MVTQLPALPVLPSTPRFPASCLAALSIYKWKRKPDYFYKTEGEARGSVSFLFLPVASNFLTRVFYFQNFVLHKHRRPFSNTRATSGNFQYPFRQHGPVKRFGSKKIDLTPVYLRWPTLGQQTHLALGTQDVFSSH